VGGDAAAFATVKPLFDAIGNPDKVIRIGESGAGQVCKVCNQMVIGGALAVVSEAFALARKAGVDPTKVREALLGGFAASRVLAGPAASFTGQRQQLIDATRQALYACKITSYAQGMALLHMASAEYHYDIQPGEVARIWRAGCIIRAALLGDIRDAYRRQPALVNLMLDRAFRDALAARQEGWRHALQTAIGLGIPMPAMSSSLAYYDAYRAARLPANVTQAQRDFFGAHTYRRVDRDGTFHTKWADA